MRIYHVGIIYKVDNTYVYTIEGNTSGTNGVIANGGGVCKKKYIRSYSSIAGYGHPNYDIVASYTTEKIATGKSGLLVYSNLNIRNNPGTSGTSVVGTYSKGSYIFPTEKTFIHTLETKTPWYKTDKGWVSARYLSGWVQESNGQWWWLKNGYGYISNDWKEIDNKWYFFDKDGWMVTGWVEWKDNWYYLGGDGTMVTDVYILSKDGMTEYYLNEDGIWDTSCDKPSNK